MSAISGVKNCGNYYENDRAFVEFLSKFPNVKKLYLGYKKIDVVGYSVKKNQSNKELLELFDRTQATRAATLDKEGSYEYKRPCERIGTFIDFSEQLTSDNIYILTKTIYNNRRNIPGYQSKHNIQKPNFGPYLKNYCLHFNDPNSLFHGFMPFEEEGQKMISAVNKIMNIYDPLE